MAEQLVSVEAFSGDLEFTPSGVDDDDVIVLKTDVGFCYAEGLGLERATLFLNVRLSALKAALMKLAREQTEGESESQPAPPM